MFVYFSSYRLIYWQANTVYFKNLIVPKRSLANFGCFVFPDAKFYRIDLTQRGLHNSR